MSTPARDPYTVLGLAPTATAAEIKRAYTALVRQYPPEREPTMFKQIRAAYEELRDPDKRIEVDMLMLELWHTPKRTRRMAPLDLALHSDDVLALARSLTDLGRSDWRDTFQPVKLEP